VKGAACTILAFVDEFGGGHFACVGGFHRRTTLPVICDTGTAFSEAPTPIALESVESNRKERHSQALYCGDWYGLIFGHSLPDVQLDLDDPQ
jgi:hypothetical protein